MKVQADNINGVYTVESFDGEVMDQTSFYSALKDNPDSSVICAEIDEAMAEKIDTEYGIH